MKFLSSGVLALVLFLTGCASTQIDQAGLEKVKKVAIVGFTLDYSLSQADRFKSALMGREKKMGLSKVGGRIVEKAISNKAYQQLAKDLNKTRWKVAPYSRVVNAPTVKAFYNKKVKVGFLPLKSGYERYKANGVPQYHFIQALKKSGKLKQMASEIGVDALVFVYVSAGWSKAFSLGPIGFGSTKYRSNILLDVYSPFKNKNLLKKVLNGKKVVGDKAWPQNKKLEYGSFKAIQKTSKDLIDALVDKI